MVTLGDAPFIRYFDPSGKEDGIAAKFAKQLNADMDEFILADPDFPGPSEFRKTILIVTDRSFDMIAPFIHEFTYQAMMNDVLGANDKAVVASPIAEGSVSFANLDENDPIWVNFIFKCRI